MTRLAIFCGGPSSEHDVSLLSAKSILSHLDRKKYEPYIFYSKKSGESAFFKSIKTITAPLNTTFQDFDTVLKVNKTNFDVALLAALHGEFGEDGTIQKKLEDLSIPYTGSNSQSSTLCIDKYDSMKSVEDIKGLHTPYTFSILTKDADKKPPLEFPFIIKPNLLGSSVLVFLINTQKEYEKALASLNRSGIHDILIQEYISGIELSCGCLEKKDGTFIPLPPIEIRPKSNFFDYSAKYELGGSDEIVPPVSISNEISQSLSDLAIAIHKKLNCSTYSRSDFIVRDGKIYFLEINTLPGMTATSLIPQEANAQGISFSELIDFIIEERSW